MSSLFTLVYDGPDTDATAAVAAAAAATAAAAIAAADGEKKLSLTQTELNKMMADNRKKLTSQNQELITQLETLKEQTNLTVQQKEELETRIGQLEALNMTKEELLKKENAKKEKQYLVDQQ